jgi:hypothetical protein
MTLLTAAGITIAMVGLLLETIGIMAMGYWPLRRRLPSPFPVQGAGFIVFVIGLLIAAAGKMPNE